MVQELPEGFIHDLVSEIGKGVRSKEKISQLKNRLCKRFKMGKTPTDIEIMLIADTEQRKHLGPYLLTKPMRTQSGVAPVALMTKPINCKHGRCTYCPGGKGSFFGDVPQSYTGHEPSTMRAIRNAYDPYLIAMNRLEQYTVLGHDFSKVESIVMGGTFTSFDRRYQDYFLKYMFKAYNDFSGMFFKGDRMDLDGFKNVFQLPGDIRDNARSRSIRKTLLGMKGRTTLEKEQKRNELAKIRCVALCLETRPDWVKPRHIDLMLKQGCTRVEMGIQSVHDEILERIHRCHTVKESIDSTRYLKDGLLKVGYHMMLGLPGVDPDDDLGQLRELIRNPDFRPDALKIYPCMVMPGTVLHAQYRRGEYTPMDTNTATQLIARYMKEVPRWMRIMRVQRDIPTKVTIAGVDRTNLRQYVDEEMGKTKGKSQDIRAREPKKPQDPKDWVLVRQDYDASKGQEVFLSIDNKRHDELLGFCRLRIPARPWRGEFTSRTAGLRELHVYGTAVPLGSKGDVQHRGIGKRLLQEAERIAKEEYKKDRLLIISGIGAKAYYRRLGYKKKGPYMMKRI